MATIQAGTYEVEVVEHALGVTSTKKQQLAVTFRNEAGDTITAYLYFTPACLERTMETLTQVLGWRPEDHDYRIDVLHGGDLLVGNKCSIVVEDEEYQGKVRPKVKWINPSGGGGLRDRMEDMEAKAFSNDLRRRLLASKGPAPNAARSAAPSRKPKVTAPPEDVGETPADDDDIPLGRE